MRSPLLGIWVSYPRTSPHHPGLPYDFRNVRNLNRNLGYPLSVHVLLQTSEAHAILVGTVPAQQGRDSDVAGTERLPYGASPDLVVRLALISARSSELRSHHLAVLSRST